MSMFPNKTTDWLLIQKLFERLRKKYRIDVKKCHHSPYGITLMEQTKVYLNKFLSNNNSGEQKIFEIPEYQQGFFEVQDEASQLAAFRVDCKVRELSMRIKQQINLILYSLEKLC